MTSIFEYIGSYSLPIILVIILVTAYFRGVSIFDAFVDGVKQGLPSLLRLLPVLVGLVTAVTVFRTGGASDILCSFLSPLANFLGLSQDLIPLAILKPISGSASATLAADIISKNGADSQVGIQAAVLLGCGDTVMYIISAYFSSSGIKKLRYAWIPILISSAAVILLL